MKSNSIAKGGLAIALLLVSACGQRQAAPEPEDVPQDIVEFPTPTRDDDTDDDRQPLPDDVQIYRDESGLFALALPSGYSYETMDSGITFLSGDRGFGGVIQHQTTDVENIVQDSLDELLKQTIETQFSEVSWQSELEEQADGSFRLDWNGINAAGAKLDALSFIEQHDTTLFILTAYGIDQAYSDYNDDAQIIVGTYVVQENPPEDDPLDADADGETDATTN